MDNQRSQPPMRDESPSSIRECFRLVADQLSQPAWIADPDGGRWFNQGWFKYTGLSSHAVRNSEWRVALHEEDRERVAALFRDALATGKELEETLRLRRHDGQWRWFRSHGRPVRGPGDAIIFWFAIATDVTQQREAEQALLDANSRLNLALDASMMGVWDWNLRTDRARWTGKIYRSIGLPESLDGSANSFIDRIYPQDRERVLKVFNRAFEGGQPFDFEFRCLTDDGQLRWLGSRGRSSLGPDGKPEQAVGINFDITERKRIEEQLREVDARRNEFLAMLGHELRNPLAPIVTSMALLPRIGELQPKQQALVEVVQRQTQHLKRLVDDLLEVSRVTQGRIELHKGEGRLSDLVRDAVETVHPLLEQRKHRIISDVDDALRVEVDPARITQVYVNVLNNSIKYTPDGGLIRITTSTEGNDWVVVRIADNGMGIGAELLPKVFDLFTQGDRSLHRSEGGLGIGLALVRQLVELHGGKAWVTSPGESGGTTVSIRLPLHIPKARASDLAGHEPGCGLEPLRLVVVDDNEDAARSLGMLLESDGHEVQVAFDPKEGLRLIRQCRPSAALVDIGMPGMDGYELARQIRQDPLLSDVAVVAITGFGLNVDRLRARSCGFGAYLLKPVAAGDIYQAVASALEFRRF